MEALTDKQRKILSLALFGYGMRAGPPSFAEVEEIIRLLGIEKEFSTYATGFVDYSKKKKDSDA